MGAGVAFGPRLGMSESLLVADAEIDLEGSKLELEDSVSEALLIPIASNHDTLVRSRKHTPPSLHTHQLSNPSGNLSSSKIVFKASTSPSTVSNNSALLFPRNIHWTNDSPFQLGLSRFDSASRLERTFDMSPWESAPWGCSAVGGREAEARRRLIRSLEGLVWSGWK